MSISRTILAVAAIVAAGSAFAQGRGVEAEFGQGLQQSALAFAAQNQWRGSPARADGDRYIGGRRLAGRTYDEPPGYGRPIGRDRFIAYPRAYR